MSLFYIKCRRTSRILPNRTTYSYSVTLHKKLRIVHQITSSSCDSIWTRFTFGCLNVPSVFFFSNQHMYVYARWFCLKKLGRIQSFKGTWAFFLCETIHTWHKNAWLDPSEEELPPCSLCLNCVPKWWGDVGSSSGFKFGKFGLLSCEFDFSSSSKVWLGFLGHGEVNPNWYCIWTGCVLSRARNRDCSKSSCLFP